MKNAVLLSFLVLFIFKVYRPPVIYVDQPVDTTRQKVLFEEFLKEIPNHQLPVNFRCGMDSGIRVENDQKFEKYKMFFPRDFDVIYGSIGNTENFKLIIFGISGDDIYPTLYSYDNYGKKIDSLDLTMVGCGGADESVIPYTLSQIDQNLNIMLWDTIEYIHFSEDGQDYVVDSLQTNRKTYKLDLRGKIQKM